MKTRLTFVTFFGVVSALSAALAVTAQNPARSPQSGTVAGTRTAQVLNAQRALLSNYCIECHNNRARTANLSLEALDITRVAADRDKWEKVVRKLRAGMMPPPDQERPEKAEYAVFLTWLENELDRTAEPYTPAPGLHRLNRTEYANAIRDLLDLRIDVAKYLPSDDSSGFDNMAGTLSVSSTLVEAYVAAAQKISRLALGEPVTPSLYVYRTPEDSSQGGHVEGLPFGTRGGVLLDYIFPSEGEYTVTITPIFGDNMSPTGFGSVECEKVEVLLDGERIQLIDWQGGRGGGGNANCGGGGGRGGQGRGNRGEQAAGAEGVPAAPAGANRGGAGAGQGQGGGNRGGANAMRVRFKTTAGPHKLGVTYLATHLAPVLDYNKHFMRDTVQTGPTPGYTFFPHIGTVRIEGPFNAVQATDSPSRRKVFVCRPAVPAEDAACAEKILRTLATQAYRRPATAADMAELMPFYREARQAGDFDYAVGTALARMLAGFKFIY